MVYYLSIMRKHGHIILARRKLSGGIQKEVYRNGKGIRKI